jgi:hypothetical protein
MRELCRARWRGFAIVAGGVLGVVPRVRVACCGGGFGASFLLVGRGVLVPNGGVAQRGEGKAYWLRLREPRQLVRVVGSVVGHV